MSRKLRVLHLAASSRGGAGQVVKTLQSELPKLVDIDSKLIDYGDENVAKFAVLNPGLALRALADEYLVKNPDWISPVSVFRNQNSSKGILDRTIGYDVVHVHWTHGLIAPDVIANIGCPLILTLHDMRTFTGACHQALECRNLNSGCQACPAVRRPFRRLVEKNAQTLLRLLSGRGDAVFVAPSHWLRDQVAPVAEHYSLDVRVIHHGLLDRPPTTIRSPLGKTPRILVMGGLYGSRLKGVKQVQDLILALSDKAEVTVIGNVRIEGKVRNLGVVSSAVTQELLDDSDIAVIPSQAESFSLAALEAATRGLWVSGHGNSAIQEVARTYGNFVPISELEALVSDPTRYPNPRVGVFRSGLQMASAYAEIYRELKT